MRSRSLSIVACVVTVQAVWAQTPPPANRGKKADATRASTAAPPPAQPATEIELDLLPPTPPPPPPPLVRATSDEPPAPTPQGVAAHGTAAQRPRLHLTPTIGFGITSEASVHDAAGTFTVGGTLAYDFTDALTVSLGSTHLNSSRTYLGVRLDPTQRQASSAQVYEQRVALELLARYELTGLMGVRDKRVQLAVVAGPSTRFFSNDSYGNMSGGVGIGGRARWAFSDQLDVMLGGLWTYNFFFKNTGLASALGKPMAVSTLDGSFGLHLSDRTRLGVGYSGELLTLDHSYRFYHSLGLTFDLAI